MENNEEIITKTNDLIASLTYYRFVVSKSFIEDEMLKNFAVNEQENDNVFKKGIIKVGNSIKKSNTSRLEEEKNKVEQVIEEFKNDCSEDIIYQYGESEETLSRYIEDFLSIDKNNYLRYQVALSVLIDNRYKCPRSDKSLEEVSKILFKDKKRLSQINKVLNKNLRKLLSDQTAENVGKGVLLTLGIAIAATTLLGGLVFAGSANISRNVGQIFSNLGHKSAQQFGKGIIIATGVISGVAIVGGLSTVGIIYAKDIYDDEKKYKEAIRALTPEDLSAQIAIRVTLLELVKEKINSDLIKEYKESILKDVDYLRSDAEYLYIIEKIDEKNNKLKSSICNKTVSLLTSF